MSDDDSGTNRTCRFCFEDDSEGELIAPCACTGSQKYVHRTCLTRWQAHQTLEAASRRSEPSNPVVRCNVCHSTLQTPPPSGVELLSVVRPNGAQIAAVIGRGSLLVSRKTQLPDVSTMPLPLQVLLLSRLGHWLSHVYLLHTSEAADGGNGDDRILGVNMTREIFIDESNGCLIGATEAEPLEIRALKEKISVEAELLEGVAKARAAGVLVRFFIGGPCVSKEIVCIHAEEGVDGSCAATAGEDVRFGGGYAAVLGAATARAQQHPGAEKPVVCLCYGHARWAKNQLQNEVLRGDWGLNLEKASAAHLLRPDVRLDHAALLPESAGTHYIADAS